MNSRHYHLTALCLDQNEENNTVNSGHYVLPAPHSYWIHGRTYKQINIFIFLDTHWIPSCLCLLSFVWNWILISFGETDIFKKIDLDSNIQITWWVFNNLFSYIWLSQRLYLQINFRWANKIKLKKMQILILDNEFRTKNHQIGLYKREECKHE